MITVSGRTFDHRGTLKAMGGAWNDTAKVWEFDRLSQTEMQVLRSTPGIMVTENAAPVPRQPKPEYAPSPRPTPTPAKPESDDLDELIGSLLGNSLAENARPIHGDQPSAIYGDDPQWINAFKNQNPRAHFGFSSLGAMVDYLEALPADRRRSSGWDHGDARWRGTSSMSEALRLAREGWPEGIENAGQIVEALDVAHAVQRRRVYDVAGGAVNVGRMLAGDPLHMVRRPLQPGRKIVTLFVECSASAAIKADNIVARAAIIAALADIMEQQGYSCEIIVTEAVTDVGNRPGAQSAVVIKRAGEKLNLSDVVFALGHPSFLRRLCFGLIGSSTECRSLWEHQGMPAHSFDEKHHPVGRNQFYIRPLTMMQQRHIDQTDMVSRAMSMLPFVKPHGLPIEVH